MAEFDPAPINSDHLEIEGLQVVQPRRGVVENNRIVGFNSRDKRSRPFNLMRTQLAKQFTEEQIRLIGVTSATPAAGKSFLSVNLAASLSRVLQVPTYLVDLDLRRGSVAEELGIEFENGISDYLLGEDLKLRDTGLRLEGTKMAVFPTRTVSIDSAQAIAGGKYDALVQTMRNKTAGAVVIFDLPPVFANDDAVLSTRLLDGYIMVIDSGKTTRRQLTDSMEMLNPVPCLGTVLNRYAGGILDSYGYGSASYDQYYSD
ncbi:CpsD/CapB family tyrosine-protein kinase [Altererythrobacter sp. SALINAS58]|uniref:CpsD/CapB family tyrosine-protein kinase n=1 Tax=Alteripontixanthobacter muriae TaxID=2705546 RepID=UPI001575C375|nr:CpsD/CapB family tyrosine-protein kinase [Alteripontixanthobacter muriae]NTZ43954.1 CpsD/CapB family tyrosine-protein kinase [Alteripontixanthobacter muriae]